MKKFIALLAKEKGDNAMNESENDDSDIPQALYRLYLPNHTYYLLTCLTHLVPVLLSYRNLSTDLLCKSNDWFLFEGNTGINVLNNNISVLFCFCMFINKLSTYLTCTYLKPILSLNILFSWEDKDIGKF